MSDTIKHITDDIFSFRKTAHWCICIVHATQSNCCGTLDFLSPETCPKQPEHWLQNLGSHAAGWVWVVKKSRSDELNSANALIQHLSEKMRFSCFPVLPGSAETQVTWGGIVKRLFIAYFIGNISAKKYQNVLTYVKVIANQRWDVFWETVYTSGYATWFTAGVAIRIAHYDVITRKL